ncbi:hypothetical protein EHE19_005735 [Ruminiclostridium herbifermentans]|uniref:Uncharacterized protein n=1 Tax=Ruminiclostridium herbifermentans TaxID=2488810 RepID=A0A7H1VRD2_9FIRM|nr:hypothetical protein EHE19_005735 [Ruminiclostridium herbifermentans]
MKFRGKTIRGYSICKKSDRFTGVCLVDGQMLGICENAKDIIDCKLNTEEYAERLYTLKE